MPNKIQIKRSSTASATPAAGALDAGELAINTADGRLFAKNSAGTVVNLPVTSISGQTITPDTVGVNVASPTSKLHVKATEANGGQDSVAKLLSSQTTTLSDANWKGRTLLGAQNLTFLVGCFNTMAAIGAHSWTSADSQTGASWADMYFNPDGDAKVYIGAASGTGWTPNQGILCVDNNSGNIGVGTANPQTKLQIVTGYDHDPNNDAVSPATSELYGAAQTEIFQVISGGHTEDNSGETPYVNIARFHVNGPASRGSISLSNSGAPDGTVSSGAWENNVLQFFVHGPNYAYGYYGGNASDAGCAMIVTQGADIVKLQIGNYNAAPIEFFTDNTPRFAITTDGNYVVQKSVDYDFTDLATFSFYNSYDSGAGAIGDLASIRCKTGSSAALGTLIFATGNSGSLTDRMVINEYGQVGIGTDAPAHMLEVVSTGDGVIEIARFRRQDSLNNDGAHFSIHADNTNNLVQLRSSGTSAGAFAFYAGNNERMRMLANGDLGLGTSSPSAKLDVVGNAVVSGTLTVGGSGVQKTITSGTAAPSGGVDGDIYLQYT
jgi:hypothetical protein